MTPAEGRWYACEVGGFSTVVRAQFVRTEDTYTLHQQAEAGLSSLKMRTDYYFVDEVGRSFKLDLESVLWQWDWHQFIEVATTRFGWDLVPSAPILPSRRRGWKWTDWNLIDVAQQVGMNRYELRQRLALKPRTSLFKRDRFYAVAPRQMYALGRMIEESK